MRMRLDPFQRKEMILDAAIALAIEQGYQQVTRGEVAKRARCVSSLINHYFNDIAGLKTEIMQTAIKKEIIPILAENYVRWGAETANISDRLKAKIVKYITN